MHQEARIALTWMHSGGKDDCPAQCDLLRPAQEVRNYDHLTIVTSQSFSQNGLPDLVFGVIRAQPLKKLAAVRVSVRVAMSHKYLIIVILEGALKGESVVGASTFSLHCVLVVADILAVAIPAYSTWFCCFFDRIDERLLPLVIRAIGFYQIYYVEFVSNVLAYVVHFEVVPLRVACRAIIVLQYQIVGVITTAQCSPKISCLEPAFKDERIVTFRLFHVIWLQTRVVTIYFLALGISWAQKVVSITRTAKWIAILASDLLL